MAQAKKTRGERMPYVEAVAPVASWGYLAQYREKTALQFHNEEALDQVIDVMWSDATLRAIPRTYLSERTMLVPTVALALLRDRFCFAEVDVVSAGVLPVDKAAMLRREQGTF